MNNWIGPVGRITLGLVIGLIFLVFGWFRAWKYVQQGSIFLVLGSTTILLTLFAARQVYDFFTPASALGLMFLSATFVTVASVRFSRVSLAVAGLVLGALAPLLTHAETTDYIGLFLYLLVLIMSSIWVIALRGWRELSLISLLVVFFYSLPHLVGMVPQEKSTLLLPFIYAFAVSFFVVNTKGMLFLEKEAMKADLLTAFGNGLLLIAWIVSFVHPESLQSLVLSVWMVVFLIGAFLVFRLTAKEQPFFVYSGVSLVFLGTATAILFDGAALTLAYTFEAALIVMVATMLLKKASSINRLKWLFILPVALSLKSASESVWHTTILQEHFFVLLILAFALGMTGVLLLRKKQNQVMDDGSEQLVGWDLIIIGSLYILRLLWLCFGVLFAPDTAVMMSLVVYTVLGLVCYFRGGLHDQKGIRLYGALCLGFVVARLFLIDVWEMEMAQRIITFVVLGLLLMSTAFVGRKK